MANNKRTSGKTRLSWLGQRLAFPLTFLGLIGIFTVNLPSHGHRVDSLEQGWKS